jgi:hypothetical protein
MKAELRRAQDDRWPGGVNCLVAVISVSVSVYVRMPFFHWHDATMGDLAGSMLELDRGVMDLKTGQ